MLSKDTTVQLGAVLVAVALMVVATRVGFMDGSPLVRGSFALLFYGLVFGGAHLYLAVRGEDGMVPVEARWRYVGMVAVLLGAGALLLVGGDRTVGPVAVQAVGTAVVVLTLLAYFVLEAIAGYRATNGQSA